MPQAVEVSVFQEDAITFLWANMEIESTETAWHPGIMRKLSLLEALSCTI